MMEDGMDGNDDDYTMNQHQPARECQNGECQTRQDNTDPDDHTAVHHQQSSPNASAGKRHQAPSAEKRRRRLEREAAVFPNHRGRHADIGYFNEYYNRRNSWMDNSMLVGMLGFLFLLAVLQKDKIINDIRRSKKRKIHTRRIRTISAIIVAHLIVSPIRYVKHLLYQSFNVLLGGVTNPLHFPRDVWGLICFLIEDARVALDRIYWNIFGSPASVTVRAAERRRESFKGDDSLPELENEDCLEGNGVKNESEWSQQQLSQKTVPMQDNTIRYDINELPPAFLSVGDYPRGWLVYHPKYGVAMMEDLSDDDKMLGLLGHSD